MANNASSYLDDDMESSSSLLEQVDLQHYLRVLRKYKWLITAFTAIVTGLAIYYVQTATPIYRSTSTLLIEPQKTQGLGIEELYGFDTTNADYYSTQFELLKSRTLATRVVEHMDLWIHPELSNAASKTTPAIEAPANISNDASETDVPVQADSVINKVTESFNGLLGKVGVATTTGADFVENNEAIATENAVPSDPAANPLVSMEDRQRAQKERAISNFMSRLTVAPVRKTKLVKVSYESADPILAAKVANTVNEQYIVSYLEAKMEMTKKASTWMGGQLAELKTALNESKQKLIDYKQANGLVDVGNSVARLNEQELLLLTSELAQARSELASANDIYRQIRSLSASPELLETVPGVQADPLVQRVKIEEGQAQRQLDELLNRYGERHPRVVDAKSQLSTLNSSLRGHVSRVVGSIEKDYQLSRQRVASIEAKLAAGKQEIQAIGTKQFELDALEREVATNQEIYDTFFNRQREATSAEGLEQANARISDPAIASNAPIKPKKQLIVALAALASLLLSALMAILYEQMDDTVKSTADVESKLKQRVLGILPLVKGGVFAKKQTLPLNPATIDTAANHTFKEAINTARTAICMDDGDNRAQVIMITSSIPGEGKSTASLNLAYSLAQLERVLLIDCDMRKPTIARALGLSKDEPGLSSLITNTALAKSCIKRGVLTDGLDVITSGPIPDQPLELLSSLRFEKMINQLKEHYDRIVIDCAPVQAVSDALVVSKVSDSVVYAVKSHSTSMDLVQRGIKRLEQVNARISGVLVTQVDIDKIVSYGGDYFYQGYYDYYGYVDGTKSGGRGRLKISQEEMREIKSQESSDLDFGIDDYMNGSPGKRSYAAAPVAAASVRNDEEFDLTAQYDARHVPESPNERLARKVSRRQNLDDELDII